MCFVLFQKYSGSIYIFLKLAKHILKYETLILQSPKWCEDDLDLRPMTCQAIDHLHIDVYQCTKFQLKLGQCSPVTGCASYGRQTIRLFYRLLLIYGHSIQGVSKSCKTQGLLRVLHNFHTPRMEWLYIQWQPIKEYFLLIERFRGFSAT